MNKYTQEKIDLNEDAFLYKRGDRSSPFYYLRIAKQPHWKNCKIISLRTQDKDKAFESNRLKGLSLEELFDEYQYWNSESQRVFDLGEGETLVKDWLSKMYEKLGLKKEPEGKETELLKGSNYYPPKP